MGETNNNNELVIGWIKEATNEIRLTREENRREHLDIQKLIASHREDFVIFKTKVNAKTAMISTGIATVALILSIILNFGSIKERRSIKHEHPEATEITQETTDGVSN